MSDVLVSVLWACTLHQDLLYVSSLRGHHGHLVGCRLPGVQSGKQGGPRHKSTVDVRHQRSNRRSENPNRGSHIEGLNDGEFDLSVVPLSAIEMYVRQEKEVGIV